jgi:hypothetical protein
MVASIEEGDSGTRHKVFDGARCKNLPGSGQRKDPCSCMHGDSIDARSASFHFARMDSHTNLDAEASRQEITNRMRESNCSSWAVEVREEAVSGVVYLLASKTVHLTHYKRVVCVQQTSPFSIAEACSLTSRIDDVRENDSR